MRLNFRMTQKSRKLIAVENALSSYTLCTVDKHMTQNRTKPNSYENVVRHGHAKWTAAKICWFVVVVSQITICYLIYWLSIIIKCQDINTFFYCIVFSREKIFHFCLKLENQIWWIFTLREMVYMDLYITLPRWPSG